MELEQQRSAAASADLRSAAAAEDGAAIRAQLQELRSEAAAAAAAGSTATSGSDTLVNGSIESGDAKAGVPPDDQVQLGFPKDGQQHALALQHHHESRD